MAEMSEKATPEPRWEQLNKCPRCGIDMKRELAVGERLGFSIGAPSTGGFAIRGMTICLEPME